MKLALLILAVILPLWANDDRYRDRDDLPEPASIGLAALGLAAISLSVYRKRMKGGE